MAVVFLEGGPVANTNANGEHQTLSWTPPLGMSIRHCRTQGLTNPRTQFVAESRIFSIVRHHAIEISPENNYQKITMTTVKTNKLAGAVKGRGRTFTSC
jgi:hypothetical protein